MPTDAATLATLATLERELKLEADLDFVVPDLTGLAGEPERLPTQELRTSYFDTADFRLWRQGMTLRLRVEHGRDGDSAMWTLKRTQRPDGPTLDRTEESWAGDTQHLPTEVADLLRGVVRRASLEKVADLVTTRRRLLFHDPDGTPSVELDDDTVTVVSGGRDGLRFRQLELELRGGHAVPEVLLRRLRTAGAHPDEEPKLAKAVDLPAVAAGPGPKPRLADVVRDRIGSLLRDLLENDVMLRRDPSNPSNPPIAAVHDARVATRRLRSDLKTFRPALDPIWVRRTRDELEWLGGLLGRVRDVDVLAPKVRNDPGDRTSDSDGKAVLRSALAHQRRAAARDLADALASPRYLDLLDRLHAAARVPPFSADGPAMDPARRALPRLVRRAWRRLDREVDAAGAEPSDAGLHRIRIKAKEVRYAAEAVCGKDARRLANAAKRLQDLLGEHHDAVAAEAWLRDQASSPLVAFAAGRLSAEQHQRQVELREEWPRAWRSLSQKKRRAWLR